MRISQKKLIQDLQLRTSKVKSSLITYKERPDQELNWREAPDRWSVLECIEHLNRYGDFYIPEITRRINSSNKETKERTFKSGWLGNYFAQILLPKEKLNKMKTLPSMNTLGSQLERSTLDKCIRQQDQLMDLLQRASEVNMTHVKTSISISKWIKLRLGDTFRVVIYHNGRHIVQADKALSLGENGVVSNGVKGLG